MISLIKNRFLLLRVGERVPKSAAFSAVMWGQLSYISVPLRGRNPDICATVISMICVHRREIIESRCESKCDDKLLVKRACWGVIHPRGCWQREFLLGCIQLLRLWLLLGTGPGAVPSCEAGLPPSCLRSAHFPSGSRGRCSFAALPHIKPELLLKLLLVFLSNCGRRGRLIGLISTKQDLTVLPFCTTDVCISQDGKNPQNA